MISAVLDASEGHGTATWWFIGAVILSGLLVLIAMVRNGINILWTSLPESETLRVRAVEISPIIALLALCVVMAIVAGPAMAFFTETANFIHAPNGYVGVVLPPDAEVTP